MKDIDGDGSVIEEVQEEMVTLKYGKGKMNQMMHHIKMSRNDKI